MTPYFVFAPLGHQDYCTDLADQQLNAARERCRTLGAHLVCLPKMCDHLAVREALSALPLVNLAGTVIFLTSWIEASVAMELILHLPKDSPLLIWAFPMRTQPDGSKDSSGSLVSLLTVRGALCRANIPFTELIALSDPVDSNQFPNTLADFVLAARARLNLRCSRIGLVGYASMGMYSGTFDHLRLRTLIGPEVIHIDTYDMIRRADALLQKQADTVSNTVQTDPNEENGGSNIKNNNDGLCSYFDAFEAYEKEKAKAESMFSALREIVTEHDLAAITVKCQYELSKQYEMTACLPLAALSEEGVVCGCEGDMMCAVSMLILRLISDRTVTYGDILDIEQDAVLFSACGFLPPSLGKKPLDIDEFPPGWGFHGLSCHYAMQPGTVTAFRISETAAGYRGLAAVGTGLETPLRQEAFPALNVTFAETVAERLLERVPSQHMALAYGDWTGPLQQLFKLLDRPIDILA